MKTKSHPAPLNHIDVSQDLDDCFEQNHSITLLDENKMAHHLKAKGSLAALSNNYEQRDSQIDLLKSISNAFNNASVGVFEAGTGVGKSFAYLLPSIEWAQTNNERVVISTGTINLQQQLIDKDIPLAKKILKSDVKAVLMKGRHNYLCKRRFNDVYAEFKQGQDLFEDDYEEIESISEWHKVTKDGSKSDLSFMPKDFIWSRICSESDACMGMRCSFYNDCFVMKVRKEAASAGLIVVNHHLLFADIESRLNGASYDDIAVLPPYKHIVFDEAHGIEHAATSFFSDYLSRFNLYKQLNAFWRVRRNSIGGLLISLERISEYGGASQNAVSLINEIKNLYDGLEQEALKLLEHSGSWRLYSATESSGINIIQHFKLLKEQITEFCALIREIIEGIDEEKAKDSIVWESKIAVSRLETISSLCAHFSSWQDYEKHVFWMEKLRISSDSLRYSDQEKWFVRFIKTPLSIADTMNSGVYEAFNTVVCTSATLQIANSFNYWLSRCGAKYVEPQRLCTDFYESPFPYKERVLVSIPTDAPLPDDIRFQNYVETAIVRLVKASDGRALVLFTSYESLSLSCSMARTELAHLGYRILKQGDDDRARLLENFIQDEQSILFATDSFWEGVDIPGETLLHVIIVKLPFIVPTDPVHKARSEFIEKQGKNSFIELSLPEAVIRFKQGFGRLMRKKTDRGVVTVLDKRILVKRYGSVFLKSIPETITMFDSLENIVSRINRFLF